MKALGPDDPRHDNYVPKRAAMSSADMLEKFK